MSDALGTGTLARVCAELIALRERNDRQHKLFEEALGRQRDELGERFDRFATDAQAAYGRLRDELTGEKRLSLALLSALVEIATDLDRVRQGRPPDDAACVAARKAEALVASFGVHRYDVAFAEEYRPAVHERVGGECVEGLGPYRVARQVEPGWASTAPDVVLRRAKVVVSE